MRGIRLLLAALLSAPSLAFAQAQEVPLTAPLSDQTMVLVAPTTGTTVTIAQTTGRELIAPSGSLLALTVTLPTCSSTYAGQILRVSSSQTITTVTMSALAGTLLDALTTILGGGAAEYTCYGPTSTWYRTG